MASSSSRLALRARASLALRSPQRCYHWDPKPEDAQRLETTDDWTAMQLSRAERRAQLSFFSQFGSTTNRDNIWRPHHQLHKPVAPRDITLNALVAAGAHMGHSSKILNPSFMPYAYGTRADITIIDMEQTLAHLRRAAALVRSIVASDGTVLFIGTRADLVPAVRKAAGRLETNAYYVDGKWLPGTLTNRIVHHGLEVMQETRIVPDCVILLNPIPNLHAIRECAIEHVPTIGIIDSNVDPRIVMYPIPANDESTRTAELIAGVLSIAAREGLALLRDK
ncbi:ribosomal protein S2, flavodoxin-like domain-containing protein, partial [Vararia minispora EC-137]